MLRTSFYASCMEHQDRLGGKVEFVRTVQAASFPLVGHGLGLTGSAVGKRVSRLEPPGARAIKDIHAAKPDPGLWLAWVSASMTARSFGWR
jgi:hypothetical protein